MEELMTSCHSWWKVGERGVEEDRRGLEVGVLEGERWVEEGGWKRVGSRGWVGIEGWLLGESGWWKVGGGR